jgi:hypothetical protein
VAKLVMKHAYAYFMTEAATYLHSVRGIRTGSRPKSSRDAEIAMEFEQDLQHGRTACEAEATSQPSRGAL